MARQRILFSCVGTSDPVRGQRDGVMMHIARRYRPEKIFLFVSGEMEKNIPLYRRAFAFMRERWGYAPEIRMEKSGVQDPSNLDEVDKVMRGAFEAFAATAPDAEILINLSSGTPQMEIILSQLALSGQYRAVAVQVKNPEGKAGTSKRVNDPAYNLEEELEGNRDELPDAPNRCVTPSLFPIRRERRWRELRTLLERGDYAAALDRAKNCLSPALADIIDHLRLRDLLRDDEARRIAARLPSGLQLYPGSGNDEYWENVNYWLMMKNLLRMERYSDFLLRLSVLTLFLEEAYLRTRLDYDALTYPAREYGGDRVLSMDALKADEPGLYEKLRAGMSKNHDGSVAEPKDGRSVFLYTRLLKGMGTPKRLMKFFNLCDNLSGQRNHLAHRRRAVSREDFEKAAQMSVETFVKEAEQAFAAVWPDCAPDAFSVHERALAYIEGNR